MEKYGTAGQATGGTVIWRMRCACWITKDTDTNSEYVILLLTETVVMQTAYCSLKQWLCKLFIAH